MNKQVDFPFQAYIKFQSDYNNLFGQALIINFNYFFQFPFNETNAKQHAFDI